MHWARFQRDSSAIPVRFQCDSSAVRAAARAAATTLWTPVPGVGSSHWAWFQRDSGAARARRRDVPCAVRCARTYVYYR